MTIKQQNWLDEYNKALQAKVDALHEAKQVPSNAEVPVQYSKQCAEEMFENGAEPGEAANFVAMSLVRRPLLDEIRDLSIQKRSVTDPQQLARIEACIGEAKAKYNELMGMQCFEERKPLHEGVDLPNMICFGRGYGENSNPMDTSVISRFNNLVARNDPYTGQINPVLSRTQQFEYNNASKYKPDPNPELDKYVDTVFLGDMGPEAFTVNGENPYRVLDKIRAGEEVDLGPVAHGIAARPNLPDVVKETPSEEPDYVETFDSIFTPGT